MTCLAMEDCVDPQLAKLALWGLQRTDAEGDLVNGSWEVLQFECRDPSDTVVRRPTLTWQSVASQIRRVGVPAGEVVAPEFTLVNLDTTFYTEPRPIDRTLDIIGYAVEVQISPVRFLWHWGDGESQTTHTPGQPYPSTEITHTYLRATDESASLSVSVDVTYSARYRVDGGGWLDIPESITVDGADTAMPVKQASAVLVQP